MDYTSSSQYSFFQRIKGAVSGNADIIQNIKANKLLKEAIYNYLLSSSILILIYSLISYQRFVLLSSPANIIKLLGEHNISENVQTLVIAASSRQSFTSVLAAESGIIFALLIGLAICWAFFSLIFHLFAKNPNEPVSFTEFFVFTSYLLPFSSLFAIVPLFFSVAGFMQVWPLIYIAFVLAIIIFIILLRALILGISNLYNLSKGRASLMCLIGIITFILLLVLVWLISVPSIPY